MENIYFGRFIKVFDNFLASHFQIINLNNNEAYVAKAQTVYIQNFFGSTRTPAFQTQ